MVTAVLAECSNQKEQELENDIHTRGCLQPLRAIFEKYAVHLGAVVAAIILPVCFGVCLSQCLARQIDYQHYLLEREEKRYERRKRRERRYQNHSSSNPVHNSPQYPANEAHLMEQGLRSKKSTPPSFHHPYTRNEADAQQLAAAIAASKKEYRREERRRQRALSTSPLSRLSQVDTADLLNS
uniref:Uncharacterized protein n=1 Tax=Ditylenchus dipsaci TaxID=166011 RepID=A0A915D9L5_9BILA